jgi:hypothetical protein
VSFLELLLEFRADIVTVVTVADNFVAVLFVELAVAFFVVAVSIVLIVLVEFVPIVVLSVPNPSLEFVVQVLFMVLNVLVSFADFDLVVELVVVTAVVGVVVVGVVVVGVVVVGVVVVVVVVDTLEQLEQL